MCNHRDVDTTDRALFCRECGQNRYWVEGAWGPWVTEYKFQPVLTNLRCPKCHLRLMKNFAHYPRAPREHVGYFHRCGASASGRMDGNGPIVKIDLLGNVVDWKQAKLRSKEMLTG